jgi:flagellar protein FliO/FliZ
MDNPVIDGADILSLGASMLIVVGAVIALGWLYSRMRFSGNGSGDVINILASRALGPKERLLLVEVADQQLLVGMTASQVRTLHTFDKPVVAEQAINEAPRFADRLRVAVRGAGK